MISVLHQINTVPGGNIKRNNLIFSVLLLDDTRVFSVYESGIFLREGGVPGLLAIFNFFSFSNELFQLLILQSSSELKRFFIKRIL